jgi:hypothetical protein
VDLGGSEALTVLHTELVLARWAPQWESPAGRLLQPSLVLDWLVTRHSGAAADTLLGKLALHQSELSLRASASETRLQEIVAARQALLAMLEEREAARESTR